MTAFSAKAELDEELMDKVCDRMLVAMKDLSPNVRTQAILALQRLQDPEKTDDPVTKAYIYHMEHDPATKVRQAAITAIAKKFPVFQYLQERLHDVDEKVRRHTYIQMCSYAVKSYKIVDRIAFLEAGLFERSEHVKKIVANMLLPNWIAAYENDYVVFLTAIKMDSKEDEFKRFLKLAQAALSAIFK